MKPAFDLYGAIYARARWQHDRSLRFLCSFPKYPEEFIVIDLDDSDNVLLEATRVHRQPFTRLINIILDEVNS